jgi:choline dehydrogenase-like flavoprotein
VIFDALDPTVALSRSADVVIVGTGPAALTIASLLGPMTDVLLVEAGSLHASPVAMDSLTGRTSGLPYPLAETRTRQFGGATSIWAGYCALFDNLDFENRPGVRELGWPIDAGELTCHYASAAELLNLDGAGFDADLFRTPGIDNPVRCDPERFQASVWRFGSPKADFALSHLPAIGTSRSVHVLLSTCVIDIEVSRSGASVTQLKVRSAIGKTGTIKGRCFILAAGGIETARLLLASRSRYREGVANGSGMVGRGFMEHPHLTVEGIEMRDDLDLAEWTNPSQDDSGALFSRLLGMSERSQRSEHLLNARAHLFRTPAMTAEASPRLGIFFEQSPEPHSRVTLDDNLDQFGMPRVNLHWTIAQADRRSHEAVTAAMAEELVRIGCARATGPFAPSPQILHSNHQLGTTRMSAHPNTGVVDPNCRVHDLSNLYIAGGSVFPSTSWANPTMTVLALSLRLGQHLVHCRGNA